MRHKKGNKTLNKDTSERLSMIRNQVDSLFQNGYLTTTLARAKETRRLAEKLISRARGGSLDDLRHVNEYLYTKEAYLSLKNDIVPAVGERESGFVSLVKIKKRRGDGAVMAKLFLPDLGQPFEERLVEEPEEEEEFLE